MELKRPVVNFCYVDQSHAETVLWEDQKHIGNYVSDPIEFLETSSLFKYFAVGGNKPSLKTLTGSSKRGNKNDEMVVTTPKNKLSVAKLTKAVLGTLKIKEAGYINEMEENLLNDGPSHFNALG